MSEHERSGLGGLIAFAALSAAGAFGFAAGRATAPLPPVLEQLAVRHNQLADRLMALERSLGAAAPAAALPARQPRPEGRP